MRSTCPDLLELLLFGAGTLIIYSTTGRMELRRIHHVPFLPLLRRRIDRILEATRVTADQAEAVIDEKVEAETEETAVAAAAFEIESESESEELGSGWL